MALKNPVFFSASQCYVHVQRSTYLKQTQIYSNNDQYYSLRVRGVGDWGVIGLLVRSRV